MMYGEWESLFSGHCTATIHVQPSESRTMYLVRVEVCQICQVCHECHLTGRVSKREIGMVACALGAFSRHSSEFFFQIFPASFLYIPMHTLAAATRAVRMAKSLAFVHIYCHIALNSLVCS